MDDRFLLSIFFKFLFDEVSDIHSYFTVRIWQPASDHYLNCLTQDFSALNFHYIYESPRSCTRVFSWSQFFLISLTSFSVSPTCLFLIFFSFPPSCLIRSIAQLLVKDNRKTTTTEVGGGLGRSSFFRKSHWRHLRRLIRRGFPLCVAPSPTLSSTVIRNYGEGGRITWW